MVVSNAWARALVAGHPVLDFVNTLDNRFSAKGPDERLRSYADLLDFLHASNLLSLHQVRELGAAAQSQSQQHALHRTLALRENLSTVFYTFSDGTPLDGCLTELQREFASTREMLALKWTSDDEGHACWDWDDSKRNAQWPVSILAREAESLLLSRELKSVKQCARSTCRWLFMDLSKNHTRRWCDMKLCGNRVKASRFQARRSG